MDKKLLPVCVLKLLEDYSDEAHPLTKNDIIQLLNKYYDLEIARKAVGSVLQNLSDLGYDICNQKSYYLNERQFTKSELSFLINSILAANILTKNQAKDILKKVLSKESTYMKRNFTFIHNIG